MISASKFIQIMTQAQELFEKEEQFNQALDEYDDGNYHCFLPSSIFFDKVTVPLISYAFDLPNDLTTQEEDNLIDLLCYFIYEAEWGTKKGFDTIDEIVDGKTKTYSIASLGEFYDYFVKIVEDMKNGRNKKDHNN